MDWNYKRESFENNRPSDQRTLGTGINGSKRSAIIKTQCLHYDGGGGGVSDEDDAEARNRILHGSFVGNIDVDGDRYLSNATSDLCPCSLAFPIPIPVSSSSVCVSSFPLDF